MKVKYSKTIENKLEKRLKKIRGNIVLRKDFNDLAAYRQVSRALKKLIAKKKLVKISAGIYAKSFASKYTNIPLIKGGIDSALRGGLTRLNIRFEPGSAEKAYNTRSSTQVPMRNVVRLKNRCRRKISYGNNRLIFEKNINAK